MKKSPTSHFVPLTILMMVFSVCMASCHRQDTRRFLLAADHIISENPDSANMILERINPNSLSDEADKALYQLLYPQAQFKLYKKTQSTPLDFSIDYFSKKKDYAHLLRSYYYRAAIRRDNGYDLKDCIKDYKAAEALIPLVKDTMMACRIYDDLCSINYDSWNPAVGLRYARKVCQIAIERKDQEIYVTALNNVALAFMQEEKDDSAEHYMKLAISACQNKVSDSIKSISYQNMAAFQIDSRKDYPTAMTYIRKGQKYMKSEAALFTLADIYQRTGDIDKAEAILNKLVHSSHTLSIINAHDMLSRIDTTKHQYQKAYQHKAYSDSMMTACLNRQQEDELKEIQQRYDFHLLESKHQQDIKDITITTLSIMLLICIVLLYTSMKSIQRKKRIRGLQEDIVLLNDRIKGFSLNKSSLDKRICSLSELVKKKEDTIDELHQRICSSDKQREQSLSYLKDIKKGMLSLFFIMNDEPNLDLSKKLCQDIIQCYRLLDNDFINEIESLPTISVRETVFCIMVRLNKSKEQIIGIIGFSDNAYRQMKHRISRKIKESGKLASFYRTIELR